MKRMIRAITLMLALVLPGWYFSPQIYRVMQAPESVGISADLTAPTLSASDAQTVRGSGDERIAEATDRNVTVSLFGLLPLKTVTVSSHKRVLWLGGEAVGVILRTEGVQIVGFDQIEAETGPVCPALSAGLREGDMICAIDGKTVSDSESFAELCENAEGPCTLSCLRDGTPFSATLTPERDVDGTLRIGAWVRDSTSGIGTLSFTDPETGTFAALGHGVTDVDTMKLIAPAKGFLTTATILHVRKGDGSAAGELIGRFSVEEKDAIATIEQNTGFGIGGTIVSHRNGSVRTAELAPSSAAHRGEATILSTVDGETAEYTVQVIRVDVQSSPETMGMMIEITDPVLLEKTGGIVQGMSGSPVLQDGRLIGVVTHVFLNQPTRGYCLYAEWMVRELLPLP